MTGSAAAAFCLGCRAMLDRDQACECAGEHVALDEIAAERIEEALLVQPHFSMEEMFERLGASLVVGPGAVALVFLCIGLFLYGSWPAFGVLWPYVLGIPLAVLTVTWGAFFTWSELSQRKPYFRAGPAAPARVDIEGAEIATIESGQIVAYALHQQRKADKPIVRDALVEGELILRRSGEHITVPLGRVELVLPAERWRRARSTAVARAIWRWLPEDMWRAGAIMEAKTRRGEQVALFDGALEEAGKGEASFRQAAQKELRWVPNQGRVRVKLVVG